MKPKQKILFLMNVDWRWITQRPHFLAQQLNVIYEVILLYPFSWRRKNLVKSSQKPSKLFPLIRFPFSSKFIFLFQLNSFLIKNVVKIFLFIYRPEILWISSPEMINWIPKNRNLIIIYDCMDDFVAFPSNHERIKDFIFWENKLLQSSHIVFFSSLTLMEVVKARYNFKAKSVVINNGLSTEALKGSLTRKLKPNNSQRIIVGYIGTISSWLNFDLLLEALNKNQNLNIHLIGPVDTSFKMSNSHPRLTLHGPVSHSGLRSMVSSFDAFIMPFNPSNLINSVDPVKIYEYIYFNKPIFSVYYYEMKKFDEFVDFFVTSNDLLNLIAKYVKLNFRPKSNNKLRLQFISNSEWSERSKSIHREILLYKKEGKFISNGNF
ncbi:glycosyltransferase family 1 protein [Candidatus Methylopumilus universalis]|uniref:glycosyltransferase family 1 protein n=1 Tax=Candidatus Methylopumilus universalis TaxID=2588536 RepID=UPI00112032C0|nr:glycosyltransferase family 1 protein [Candidatus Methylopumilus universalis]QDC96500.1 glycosyltransferase family 1 protein [Candidatus Methylopumilus universalis]